MPLPRTASLQTYFEAYRHVLSALQAVPDNPTLLPFSDELLGGGATRAPAYLDAPGFKPLRLADAFPGFLAATGSETLRDVREPWPRFDSGLNDSQLAAVQLVMRNRVALIQGPPGCGKTHVGVLLTRLLLRASPTRPLLFVCFTNHALDQLLEHGEPEGWGAGSFAGQRPLCLPAPLRSAQV